MVSIRLETSAAYDQQLLTVGVPFKQGDVQPGSGFRIKDDNRSLPIWWDERSHWPDSSVKWIFLHTRVPAGDSVLELTVDDSSSK